jgi:transposase
VSIVMGLDQHRAQITADWLDTDTGEVKRGRVAPAGRAAVRRFLERFDGQELVVGLEATTGWQFVVEELRRVGAEVHLAEPAETAGLRGPKKRAKNDRADARHLRELLMVKRLPESWIPPDHILDLRTRVRLRHTLSEQRSEWQQRMQATLYHHGCPQRRQLMVGDGREWLASQPLPETAREQVTVALAMIDALEVQIAPLDQQLRAYARRQAGCKALMAHYGIGELTAVTILAELGDCTRFSSSRQAVRYAGMDITVYQSDQRRAPGPSSQLFRIQVSAPWGTRCSTARTRQTLSSAVSGPARSISSWTSCRPVRALWSSGGRPTSLSCPRRSSSLPSAPHFCGSGRWRKVGSRTSRASCAPVGSCVRPGRNLPRPEARDHSIS